MNYTSEVNGHIFNEKILLSTEVDVKQQRKKEISNKLRQFSERTAAMAMEDSVDKRQRDKLIDEVEQAIRELESDGQGAKSDDPEERDIFENLQNILEILKSTF